MKDDESIIKMQGILDDFHCAIYRVEKSLDDAKDAIYGFWEEYNNVPNEALNGLLKWGLVPDAKITFLGKTYVFLGFSEGMRLMFLPCGEEGEDKIVYSDIDVVWRNIEKMEKVTENDQK